MRRELCGWMIVLAATPWAAATDLDLDSLLQRLDRAAGLFRDSALKFTCEETITWSGHDLKSGRQKFGYVFVNSPEAGLRDYRTWAGGSNRREVSPDEFDVPHYVRSAYIWSFVFKGSRQGWHDYRIVGEERVLGRPAVKIHFAPIPPYRHRFNDWFGWAWIDRETAQLLRVEAYTPEDWEEKTAFETDLRGGSRKNQYGPTIQDDYQVEKIVTEFTVVEKGMRFPGTVDIRRSRYRVYPNLKKRKFREREVLRVRQVCRNYRFFGVKTEQEIQGPVTGD